MMQTASWHRLPFLFMLFTLHLSPALAYFLKNCTIVYSDNVTAGVSVDCDFLRLGSIPDDIPRGVTSLTLRVNDIFKIHRTDLYYLSNLTDLNLSDNLIFHVDDRAFVHLVQLKALYMDNNPDLTLTDNMFQGLSNLLILSLNWNRIRFFNPAAFQSLTSLQELCLITNQITQMIPVLQLPHLKVLNVTADELESFQSKDLPLNMSSELRELRVWSESIKKFSITTAVFPHLKTIDLSDFSDIGLEWDIPDMHFLRDITTVYLSLFWPNRKALQSLDSLEYLELVFDRDLLRIICKIPTPRTLSVRRYGNDSLIKTLPPCSQLTNLDLSDNELTELSKDSIKQMSQLSHLNLSVNQLSKVPDDVKNLSELQILNLSNNHIHDLSCSDFLHLTRLTHLHLEYNDIHELKPCVFKHLNELKVLTLNHNLINRYGATFKTGLHKLESLNLGMNDISSPKEGDFKSLKSLRQLDMQCNKLDDIHPWTNNYFEGVDELERLSVNFNNPLTMTSSPPRELQWPNYNITLLQSLKSLTMQYSPQNKFTSIIWVMMKYEMKSLEHLYVENGEQPYPGSFKYVPQLKTLSLIDCNLKSLDFLAQANLTKLFWLDLRKNELTVVTSVSVFSFLPALRYINLAENTLACDCSNADFQQWMHDNNQTLVVDAHHYTCGFPLAKRGTKFLDFDAHSCWVDASFICFISNTCVIVLTLLTSFTYHFLRLHLLYAYYLFRAFLYDAKERKRGSPQRYDAFIFYNVHDELWVCREMLPVLEGEQGWRLCLHHRDFLPGKPIIENITDAIYGSRKIICVISHHYLESEWCSREIQMASYRLFDEQKDVLILVFLEDIPAHQLSPHYQMRRLVKSHTYLSWSQAGQHPGLFWQNLRRALDTPHTDLGLDE